MSRQKNVKSQIKTIIRPMYSNPPIHGALIAETILTNKELLEEWKLEVRGMADRIISMRTLLIQKLQELNTPIKFDYILNQIGMFSWTGLKPVHVEELTKDYHIYLANNGRISMAGLNTHNIDYFAKSVNAVVVKHHKKTDSKL